MKLQLKGATANSNHEHALLSPSAAKKWLGCPAALACEFGIPNESGAAAVNGTAMHSMAENILHRLVGGSEYSAKPFKGSHVLNHGKGPIKALVKPEKGAVLITDDFVSQVDKYVDYCRPIIAAAEVVEIEYRVNLTRVLHPGVMVQAWGENGEEIEGELVALATFGTADLVAILKLSDGTYMLIVGDLKTGRHRVSAKENKQMMLYALGLLHVYKRLYDITAVRLVIFQPYAGGADEWDTTPEALEQFGKYASAAALKAIDAFQRGKKGLKAADFRPSPDACQWCRFAEKCNAKRKVASSIADDDLMDEPELSAEEALKAIHKFCNDADYMDVWDDISPSDILRLIPDFEGRPNKSVKSKIEPAEMTLDQLKAEWDKLPLVRQHIGDIEKAMYAALMRGEQVEGLKLVEGRPGNRSWRDEEFVVGLAESIGVDRNKLMKESLMSPTEAEKVFKGSEEWEVLSKQVTRKSGQPSITTADDKRPEWTPVSDDDLAN